MPTRRINGVELYHEVAGEGPPVVFVHGSWGDHHSWDLVARRFAEDFTVVTYDRRGHSRSEVPPGQGTIDQDVGDLAGVIEEIASPPASVVASSFGSVVSLKLAARRPELFRKLTAHEPPAIAVLEGDPEMQPLLASVRDRIDSVVRQLEAGDLEGGT
jgi:pimeloyl-ACP methyl ester carboxylesterase